MSKDEQVILTREEAGMVDEALGDYLERLTGSVNRVNEMRGKGFRLLVKLSRVVRTGVLHWNLPDWAMPILQRTFAPLPAVAPAKKPAPKAARQRKAAKPATSAGAVRTSSPTVPAGPSSPRRSSRMNLPQKPAPLLEDPEVQRRLREAEVADVKLSGSAARRRGGLLRAAQAAEAKGNIADAAEYRERAAQLVISIVAAHSDP